MTASNRSGSFHALAVFIILFSLLFSPSSWAADTAGSPARVAILPFTMHTPSNLQYLQDGIRDMLTSRLAWQGKVVVVERTATDQAVRGVKGDLSPEDALRIGRSLKADHVLYGSITAIGQTVSIDAKMADVAGKGDPLSLSTQTRSLDDVIPQVNMFAQNINNKIFARPGQDTGAQMADADSLGNRNPELLIPGAMVSGDRISYINPNFIEITSDAALRQSGLWRSQTFNGGLVGMDVGDVDGDGKAELVCVTGRQVLVMRKEIDALRTIAAYSGTSTDRFLWVSAADINQDGKAEIFVTNLRRKNEPSPQGDQIRGSRGFTEELSSFPMALVGGKLQTIGKPVPYFLNAVEFPRRGKILLGQEKGQIEDGPFRKDIHEMILKGDRLAFAAPTNLPRECNVFNFARADINNDGSEETILIDSSSNLIIYSSAGSILWRGNNLFGATTNAFEGKVIDRRYNQVDMYSIPVPILITDLNQDGIQEVIVSRSIESLGRFLPQGLKYFDRGEIVSLSWDNMGMVENWKTREISGMVTSIRIGDFNNDGTKELGASLVLAKDFLKLWEARSSIFSYDLNISTSGAKTSGAGTPGAKTSKKTK